ncbi:uncharacterized protein LOC123515866 [Portunus trituberculatus]|uniref:uncharacterized protein LOC123515866 n=1 Tax=Portunus trituberculatus TaxID=210409 RepID=UPI001E1CE6FF|nr:uncharacterized protein LOC123515866 [Portunus trituberculatus]
MAARTDRQLKEELDIEMVDSVFWTDSMAVLQYIRNTERLFHTFVANRVATISEYSNICQWRHVRSTLNPADDASRGILGSELHDECRWIQGPTFLALKEEDWPQITLTIPDITADGPEVKKTSICLATTAAGRDSDIIKTLWAQYSSWYQLQKTVAWLRRFIQWCVARSNKTACDKGQLSVGEMEKARLAILRATQLRRFPQEVSMLKRGRQITTGPLYRLEPYLDNEGLLRVGGRLDYAILHPDHKNPIFLPTDGFITELIIRNVHSIRSGHSGREHTLAMLREDYWIPKGRLTIDKILHTCVICRRCKWKPLEQRQANLPEDRLIPGERPFTYTGTDCFGPFIVKRGQTRAKRWGCLFTCLTSRAIHLEVLPSLDADSFINTLSRFSSCRGTPRRLRSDNGTNLVGAHRELREAKNNWNDSKRIRDTILQRQIEWEFIPPAAPHMGGVWECQIRTVKKVFLAVVGNQILDDERLSTF